MGNPLNFKIKKGSPNIFWKPFVFKTVLELLNSVTQKYNINAFENTSSKIHYSASVIILIIFPRLFILTVANLAPTLYLIKYLFWLVFSMNATGSSILFAILFIAFTPSNADRPFSGETDACDTTP